jgi:hypothetical protein
MTVKEMLQEIEAVKVRQLVAQDAVEVYELTCVLIELQASVIHKLMEEKEAA